MKKNLLVIALLSALTAPAFAEDMYASIGLGSSAIPDDGSGITASGLSYSLLFGYKINKNFAAEVGYTSLLSSATMNGLSAGATGSVTANGFEIAGIGSYPINDQFSVFYRLGYASMSVTPNVSAPGYTNNTSQTNAGLVYGPGIQYDINKQIGVRVGYNIYNLPGSNGDVIINQPYVSASYGF